MTIRRIAFPCGIFYLLVLWSCGQVAGQSNVAFDSTSSNAVTSLPDGWLDAWQSPSVENRPLQIVHGIPAQRATREGMKYYQELGLGGLVCNVNFDQYMQSQEHWDTLISGVESCAALGMIVWLYDEDGYPSGAAGGLVLQENPEFEAMELAYDPSRDDPMLVRPAYEHTHASNNFYAARRYANLIDDRAIECFVNKTHEAYWQRLQPHFGKTIRAAFTDEPSLIAINIGPLPDDVRKKVRVVDAVDESSPALPRVPWSYDLAAQYEKRYGEDLMPQCRSLFEGQTPEDRKVRRQYWALIADLVSDRFFGTLQRWCTQHHIASSGHSLWEEQILHHVALEGNGLKCLGRMDIPGLDLLNSDPNAVNYSGWLTAGLPASAAMLEGRRRVMTEVSDFSQKLGGQGPVTLAQMQAVAGWQATWGVTDFTLYYAPNDRPVGAHRAYCDFVGRTNAIVATAERKADVLLYYPIYDLWAEYLPIAEKLTVKSQSQRARRLVDSFMRLGQQLQRNQISFTLVDHEYLAAAKLGASGDLTIAGQSYRTILFPEGVELPPDAASVVAAFQSRGGSVLNDDATNRVSKQSVRKHFGQREFRLHPATEQIAMGRFQRDGHLVLLVVNVTEQPYDGHLKTHTPGQWWLLDPTDGSQQPITIGPNGQLPVTLSAHQTAILVRAAALAPPANADETRPPMRWGVDDAGSTVPLLLHPKGRELFAEFGFNFWVLHYFPSPNIEQNRKVIQAVDRWCAETGVEWVANVESPNFVKEFIDEKKRSWYNRPDGRHYFMFPDELLQQLGTCKQLWGVMYDEAAHMQNCRNKISGLDQPWIFDPAEYTLEGAAEGFTQAVGKVQSLYARHGIRLSTEHVFPVLLHGFARAGWTAGTKVLKENWSPAYIACALGAALQYDTELWITPDLWGLGGYPDHSPDEYASALLLAYHMGADCIYTENLAFNDPDNPRGGLVRMTQDDYELTELGEVTKWFAKEYMPAHPRDYAFEDVRPRVAIVRQPDACWGQSDSWLPNMLFGNKQWQSNETTEAWLKVWHLLSRGVISEHSLSWHNSKLRKAQAYQVFCPLDGVVVFDHLVGKKHLKGVEVIFLTGLAVAG